jgi:hypothetical protein
MTSTSDYETKIYGRYTNSGVFDEVESVDGGYWVAARVWVYADDEDEEGA